MKKLIKSLALTLATVLVLGMTVSAAPSPATKTASPTDQALAEDAQQVAQDGVAGASFTIGNLDENWLKRAQAYADAHGLGKVVTIFDLKTSATNVNVTLRYAKLDPNKQYSFLHYYGDVNNYDATKWEVIKATLSEGQHISGFFTSFSPVGIVEGTTGAAVVAPKTGEVIALAVIMALIMMAGAAVCAKKARLQK